VFGHTTVESRTHTRIIISRVHKKIHASEDKPSWCRPEQTP